MVISGSFTEINGNDGLNNHPFGYQARINHYSPHSVLAIGENNVYEVIRNEKGLVTAALLENGSPLWGYIRGLSARYSNKLSIGGLAVDCAYERSRHMIGTVVIWKNEHHHLNEPNLDMILSSIANAGIFMQHTNHASVELPVGTQAYATDRAIRLS